ncbi:MAG: hypothetical protein NXI23_03450 [Bacteroidetes bacterium]|nr:hypothetical protein [Bacteroidota bacterium]MDF1867589.1 hypothetical protein [Saprospiraceae bacterium]
MIWMIFKMDWQWFNDNDKRDLYMSNVTANINNELLDWKPRFLWYSKIRIM